MEPEPQGSFEESLRRLEQIVGELERGDSDLSNALKRYEEGVGLLAHCTLQLDQAERSVALLMGVEPDGTPELIPFNADATVERSPSPTPRKRPTRQTSPFDDSDLPF